MSLRQAPAISTNLLRLVVLTLEPGDDALADILRDSGISPAEFLEDDGYLSWQQAHTVIGNILRAHAGPELAVRAGVRAVPAVHGAMGVAGMTSGTLGEAMTLFQKYMSTRVQFFVMDYESCDVTGGSIIAVDFLPEPDAVVHFLIQSTLASAFSCVSSLLGAPPENAEVHFMFPRPAHASVLEQAFRGCSLHFGAPRNFIRLPPGCDQRPLLSRDRQVQNMAVQQCEAQRDVLRRQGSVADQVRKRLQQEEGRLLTLEQLADQLGLSRRTLLRRLKDEGTSYQCLLDAEISRRAVFLMNLPGSTVAAVAAQLGYAEPVSFRRAFRRWFGVTPSEYRHSH